MAIDVTESSGFDTRGISIKDDDGNTLGYFTTFSGDPSGSAAPQNTWVFREDNQTLWYKYGPNNGDWRQVRADDVAFDVTALVANSPDLAGLTQTKEVIDALAFRNFGKLYAFGGNDPNTTSLGTVVEAASTTPVNVDDTGVFSFRAQWSFRQNQSKSNTTGLVEILWRSDQVPAGVALDQQTASGTAFNNLGNGTGQPTFGLGSFTTIGPQTNIELYATIERLAGNGAARINSVRLELWRI